MLAAQQKAAANRSSAPHQAASAGVSAAGPAYKPAHQQVTQMPGHASSMMYRPVASAAPVHQAASMPQANGSAKPAGQNPYVYYQQLLAFADQRWKETNQLKRRQEARKLVTESKQACQCIRDTFFPCIHQLQPVASNSCYVRSQLFPIKQPGSSLYTINVSLECLSFHLQHLLRLYLPVNAT